MKRTSTMVVLAGLAILAIAILHLRGPRQHSPSLRTEYWHASQLWADGGGPMPPWPTSNLLLADGGGPMPPWPTTVGFLTVHASALRTTAASDNSGTPRA